jgi:hypothetical protein
VSFPPASSINCPGKLPKADRSTCSLCLCADIYPVKDVSSPTVTDCPVKLPKADRSTCSSLNCVCVKFSRSKMYHLPRPLTFPTKCPGKSRGRQVSSYSSLSCVSRKIPVNDVSSPPLTRPLTSSITCPERKPQADRSTCCSLSCVSILIR